MQGVRGIMLGPELNHFLEAGGVGTTLETLTDSGKGR